MHLKVYFLAISLVCISQVLGLPSVLLGNRAEPYDTEHAKYAIVKLATESTVLKMRAFSLSLEVNHTLKWLSKDILADIDAIGANSTMVEITMKEKGAIMTQNVETIMMHADDLITLCNDINNNIANNPSNLAMDKVLLEAKLELLDTAYLLGRDNVILSVQVIELRIEIAIGPRGTSPEVDAIWAKVDQGKIALLNEQNQIDSAKAVVDIVSIESLNALQILIDAQ